MTGAARLNLQCWRSFLGCLRQSRAAVVLALNSSSQTAQAAEVVWPSSTKESQMLAAAAESSAAAGFVAAAEPLAVAVDASIAAGDNLTAPAAVETAAGP